MGTEKKTTRGPFFPLFPFSATKAVRRSAPSATHTPSHALLQHGKVVTSELSVGVTVVVV